MMKLSDYVAQRVAEFGVRHVFMVTGGGAMHLNHAFGTHKDLECIFNHHEQACSMAADAYSRLNNRPALVNVTSGPGGTNAITGVYGAYVDSISMLVISGQVKYETTVRSTGLPLRQYGDQELDIEPLVKPVTKYVAMVSDPQQIRYHLEKAFYLATNGRPGPCWLDIPLNVQGAPIDPDTLEGFDPAELAQEEAWKTTDLEQASQTILAAVANAERPVVFAGAGVRLSQSHDEFITLVDTLGVPVVTGWNAHDAIWNEHPLYIGRPGSIGDRAGNFAVQNADVLVVLGSRLNIRQVSYNWDSFARHAKIIWVDIDAVEMEKPSVKADVKIHADLSTLFPVINALPYAGSPHNHAAWVAWCLERRDRYPTVLPEYSQSEKINPYSFMQSLFKQLPEQQITVTANGSACVVSFQTAEIKLGQRLWTNSGCASMGYDLPAAIGACIAADRQPIVCLAGEGSIMMNLQELQTITTFQLPIKIFLLNNKGYVSIFQTQRNFFNGEEVGAGPSSGVTFPQFETLAAAFSMPYIKVDQLDKVASAVDEVMQLDGPVICEVILDEQQPFAPKLSAKRLPDGSIVSPPLEDLSPFLPREEFEDNMLVK